MRTTTLWLFCLALVACGGGPPAAPSSPSPTPNPQPTPTPTPTPAPAQPHASITDVVPWPFALVNVTDVHFAGSGSSPSGRPITMTWDFDGARVDNAGPGISYTFTQEGDKTIRLIVRDDRGGQATAERNIYVRNLSSNNWSGHLGGEPVTARLTQTGAHLDGTITGGARRANFVLSDPSTISGSLTGPDRNGQTCGPRGVSGSWDDNLDSLSVDVRDCGGVKTQLNLARNN